MAKLIVEQQDMSVETLERLRAHGVVENVTLLRLDFQFDAAGQSEAEELADFLGQSTDYDVDVTRGPRKGLRRGWIVGGHTQQTPVSPEILDDWIRWMVMAGAEHGECRFDGWGAFASA